MWHSGRDVSEVICQYVGVRQGCVLSPCLFSLFIADLPKFLTERGGSGVKVHTSFIMCLLFADDGAIVADTKEDLQCMLRALQEYCNEWRMMVNVKKLRSWFLIDKYRLLYLIIYR